MAIRAKCHRSQTFPSCHAMVFANSIRLWGSAHKAPLYCCDEADWMRWSATGDVTYMWYKLHFSCVMFRSTKMRKRPHGNLQNLQSFRERAHTTSFPCRLGTSAAGSWLRQVADAAYVTAGFPLFAPTVVCLLGSPSKGSRLIVVHVPKEFWGERVHFWLEIRYNLNGIPIGFLLVAEHTHCEEK